MSVATCGHEVFEGISCSLKLGKDEWSFGTYCVDCLKLYHQDDMLEDNEAKKLCVEIEKLQQQNKLLMEAVNMAEMYFEANDNESACAICLKETLEKIKDGK